MPSKRKPASRKRAALPRRSDYTKQFEKDWDGLTASGRYDMTRLREVMLLIIANAGPLPPEWKDHELKGEWADHRECHVGGDFLLIYTVSPAKVVFTRAGTHSELFKS
jgi:mRNA interferase YafQ